MLPVSHTEESLEKAEHQCPPEDNAGNAGEYSLAFPAVGWAEDPGEGLISQMVRFQKPKKRKRREGRRFRWGIGSTGHWTIRRGNQSR